MEFKKQIIAVWGISSMGKSAAIKAIFKKLKESKAFEVLVDDGDIRALGRYNGKLIGIEAQGDPKSRQGESIEDFAKNEKCDIIICASRSKGTTVHNVENISEDYGYEIIWTSNYCGRNKIDGRIESNNGILSNGLNLNDMFADAIIQLIDNIIKK